MALTGCRQPVNTPIAISGITIQSKLETNVIKFEEGMTVPLTADIQSGNAPEKTVTWTSSDTGVATVSENGTVTFKKEGEVKITALAENISDSIQLYFYNDPPSAGYVFLDEENTY